MSAKIFAIAGLTALASAYTQPTTQTYAPIVLPDASNPVTRGQTYKVQWSLNFNGKTYPSDGLTVSLVLCNGPGSNCVNEATSIASGIPAGQQSYDWNVPCNVAVGEAGSTNGHGLSIIVDQTGEFQYSTQFAVLAGSCSSSSTTGSVSASTTGSGSATSTTTVSDPFSFSSGITTSTISGANRTTTSSAPLITTTGSSTGTGPFNFGNSTTTVTTPTLTRATTTGTNTASPTPTTNAAPQAFAGAGALIVALGAAVLSL